MKFGIYANVKDTLNNWVYLLNILTPKTFRIQNTNLATFIEWSRMLNRLQTKFIFRVFDNEEKTLKEWQKILNLLF